MKKKFNFIKITSLVLAMLLLCQTLVFTAGATTLPADTAFDYSYVDELIGTKTDKNNLKDQVYLSEKSISIDAGDTYKLEAYLSGNVTVMNSVEFTSSNSTIATVDNSGNVKGYTDGTATITVKVKGSNKTDTCSVTVNGSIEIPTTPTTEPTTEPTTAQPTTVPPTTVAPTTAPPTTEPTTAKPTTAPTTVPATLSMSPSSATLYKNCYLMLKTSSNTTVTYKSSNTSVATVDGKGLIKAVSAGTATITATAGTKTATCKVTVKTGTSVNISNTSKTIYITHSLLLTSSNDVTWSSDNTAVATVNSKGIVYGVSEGFAVINAKTSTGTASCVVQVGGHAPIRFAYTSPNSAPKNSNVTFKAITDKSKTEVKFEYTINGTTKTVNATSKTTDGNYYVWSATAKLDTAGKYNVKAYSKTKDKGFLNCYDGTTTAFVTESTSTTTTSNEKRRASDSIINVIADYEGYMSALYYDPLTGDPTVGYGKVIYAGNAFYNNLTKTEAYAYLVQSVNNDGYADSVNTYLMNHNAKFNQRQYDALVCFTYNVGSYALSGDDDLENVFFNSRTKVSSSTSIKVGSSCYVNASSVNLRSGPSTSNSIVTTMSNNQQATLLSTTLYSGSGLKWYYIQLSNGTKGYICSDYLSFYGTGTMYDLSKVNVDELVYYYPQWHHAGGCIWGLLYRRIDELEIFLYGDYTRDGQKNKYGFSFACHSNPSFSIG